MPKKRRESKRPKMSLETLMIATKSEWELHWGGEAEGLAAYEANRALLDKQRRSEQWWWYTPGIPEHLRHMPDWLHPKIEIIDDAGEWRKQDALEKRTRVAFEGERTDWMRETIPDEFMSRATAGGSTTVELREVNGD